MKKKILFLSGTRADYGKLKSLMKKVDEHPKFELSVFVTGMHMLSKYGSTFSEIEKDGFKNLYKFCFRIHLFALSGKAMYSKLPEVLQEQA